MEVKNYILGDWVRGEGSEVTFHHAINGEEIGNAPVKAGLPTNFKFVETKEVQRLER